MTALRASSLRRLAVVVCALATAGPCAAADPVTGAAASPDLRIAELSSPVKVRLRGLSAASERVAWASGQAGTVLRTIDGGQSWKAMQVPGATDLDFRDVQAFGADVALVMGAGPGDASRVYRTADGGRTWTLVLRNPDADGFFDCMDFDGEMGRLLGDPVRGRFQLFATSDGGRSWWRTKGPRARKDEAAFAASGTCLRRVPGGTVVVSGGSAARLHFLPDKFEGRHEWRALEVAMPTHTASSGLFSAASTAFGVIAVGGDYRRESGGAIAFGAEVAAEVSRSGQVMREGEPVHLARTTDPNTLELRRVRMHDAWSEAALGELQFFHAMPSGYRSAVACRKGRSVQCVATGPGGTDMLVDARSEHPPVRTGVMDVESIDAWSAWRPTAEPGYDSVDIAGAVAWFSGADGRLGRAELPSP